MRARIDRNGTETKAKGFVKKLARLSRGRHGLYQLGCARSMRK
jgi:hypothetical protein